MMRGKRCLVIGGSGFMGKHLCQRLLADGAEVRSVSRRGPPARLLPEIGAVQWLASPIGGHIALQAAAQSDYIFHLASSSVPATSNEDVVTDLQTNVAGTLRLLEVLRPEQRLLFLSSGGTVYGEAEKLPIAEDHPTQPICGYGIQKLAIEKYLALFQRLRGLNTVVLRVANVYGHAALSERSFGAIAHFVNKAVRRETLTVWGDGGSVRDYVHLSDVVEAIVAASLYRGEQTTFNIGTSRGVALAEIIAILESELGRRIDVEQLPPRTFDVKANVLDCSRAHRELGWVSSITIEEGIHRILRDAGAQGLGFRRPEEPQNQAT